MPGFDRIFRDFREPDGQAPPTRRATADLLSSSALRAPSVPSLLTPRRRGTPARSKLDVEPLEPRILLSADLAPFVVAMDADHDDLTLSYDTAADLVQVHDNQSGELVASAVRAETSSIKITGTEGDDRLVMDMAGTYIFPDGVMFDGGGGQDELVGPGFDSTWVVDGVDQGTLNGEAFQDVEFLTGGADNEDVFQLGPDGQSTGGLEGGAAGFDSIVVDAGGQPTAFGPTGPSSGSITVGDRTTLYSGFEPVDVFDTPDIIVALGTGDDTDLTLAYDGSASDTDTDVFNLDGPGIETHVLHIDDDTTSVLIDLGGGADDIAISGVFDTRLSGILEVDGNTGDDTFFLGDGYGNLTLDARGTSGIDEVIVTAGGTTTVAGGEIVNDDGGDVSTATLDGIFARITGDSIVLDVDALLNATDRAFGELNAIFAELETAGDFIAGLPLISGSNHGDGGDVSLGQMAALEEMLNDIHFGVIEAVDNLVEAGTGQIADIESELNAINKSVEHLGPGVISTALRVADNVADELSDAAADGKLEERGFRFELTLSPEDGADITKEITATFQSLIDASDPSLSVVEELAAALNVDIGATELGGQVAALARDGRIGFQVLSPEATALSVKSATFGDTSQNFAESVLGYSATDALEITDVQDRLTSLGENVFGLSNVDLGLVDETTYLFDFRFTAERTSGFGFDFGSQADEQGLEFAADARLEAALAALFAADLTLDLGTLGDLTDDSFAAEISQLGAGFEIDATAGAEVDATANFGFLSTQATGTVVMDAGLEASTPLSFSSGNTVSTFVSGISFSVVGFDSSSNTLSGEDEAAVSLDFVADGGLVTGTLTLGIVITEVFNNPDPSITFGGTADVADFADFNNLTASGVIRSLSDLSAWLDDLAGSELVTGLEIPAVQGGVGAIADVASLVSNALLYDVGGDGERDRDDKLATDLNNGLASAGLDRFLRAVGTGDAVRIEVINDTVDNVEIVDHTFDQLGPFGGTISFDDVLEITSTAFLAGVLSHDLRGTFRVTANGSTLPDREFNVSKDAIKDDIGFGDDTPKLLNAFNSTTFNSATELAQVLEDIGVLPSGSTATDALDYDEPEDQLTYTVSIVDEPIFATELGTDFSIDLAPVLGVESLSRIVLTGEGTIELVLGWDLSSDGALPGTATVLDATTALVDLGIEAGGKLKTDPAVTADSEPNAIRGVLTGDASFTLSVTESGTTTSAVITVTEADAIDNTTTADLVTDINAAIGASGLAGLVTAEDAGDRLRFVEDSSTLEEISITVASGNPALQAFGLQPSQTVEGGTLVAPNQVQKLVGVLSGDATFDIKIGTTTYTVTVSAQSTFSTTASGDEVVGINRNIIDLATDVRNALREASDGSSTVDLTDQVAVGTQGSRLVLTLINDSATTMDVTAGTNAGELGLSGTQTANTNDLIVKIVDGSDTITEVPIDLSTATTIQDVIDAFADANAEASLSGFGGANLTLGIIGDDPATPEDESGKRLFVSYDDGTRQLVAIEATNGSGVATALGIVGMDVNPFDPASVADGRIEGSPIGGISLADRFFLRAPAGGDLSEIASFGFGAEAARLVTDIQVLTGSPEGAGSVTGIVGSVDFRDFVGETITFRDVNGFGTDSFTIDNVVEVDTDGEDGLDTFVAVLSGGTLPAAGSGGGVALIETGVDATASLGFIDVTLSGSAAFGADVSLGLVTSSGPAADGTLTLAELLDVFDRDSDTDILDVVAPPAVTFDTSVGNFGGVDLTVGIADPDGTFGDVATGLLSGISPDMTLTLLALGDPLLKTRFEQAGGLAATDVDSFEVSGDFTDALAEGAKLRITPDGGDPVDVKIAAISFASGMTTIDLEGVDGGAVPDLEDAANLADADIVLLPTVDADLPDFGALGDPNFADFGFEAIVAALRELVDFLGALEGFDLLAEPIPLIDRSVTDIIALGEDLAGFIDAFESDPAGSLQSVESAINDAIGLSADAISDINDAVGNPISIR